MSLKKITSLLFILVFLFASCEKEDTDISVQGVTLNNTTLSIGVGDTYKLVATVSPNDATNKRVTWSSSDPSIVSVSNDGEVTALKVGVTGVSVSTEDGKFTATCTVTVIAESVAVTNVTLNQENLELTEGDDEVLIVTISPEDATNKNVTWSSSDEKVATVDQNGKVMAIKEGQATITVSSTDGNKTASCDVTVIKYTAMFTDERDGTQYLFVTIGDQVWMAENLRYLPEVHNAGAADVPYNYVYGYEGEDVGEAKATANYSTYGALYNWAAAATACPEGWHMPSDEEWTKLADYLTETDVPVGSKLKEAGFEHWKDPDNPNIGANNQTGFTALPGGFRQWNGPFNNLGNNGYWWSSTENPDNTAHMFVRVLGYNHPNLNRQSSAKSTGFSIRCVRD